MCKFMTSLSKYSPSVGIVKKSPNLELFLQPCKDAKTYYRLRLLGFTSKAGRTDPHVVRYVHKNWVTNPETGKKRLEKVVCSAHTPWIETVGNKKASCKICNFSGQHFTIYRESGKSDLDARVLGYKHKATYEAIVPVYVKNDPNYERNNGKLKVIVFEDKNFYEKFRGIIGLKEKEVNIWNGRKGVDLLLHVAREEYTGSNGKTYYRTSIDKVKFSTEPYEIPAISEAAIDAFEFDQNYYSAPDAEDVDAFYDKYCAIKNDDIPDDDEIPVYKEEKKSTPSVKIPTNDVPDDDDDISDDELDAIVDDKKPTNDLATDPDEEGLEVKDKPKPASSKDIDSDDILAELGI